MLLASSLFSFYAPPKRLLPANRLKARDLASVLSTTTKSPVSSIQSSPTRLLATPPPGKFLREDYLVKKLSAKEIQELIKGERNVPLIIDFYATWCGPCILMAQELEMLAVEYESNAMIVKVDTDDEYEFARDMQATPSSLLI
ncbi:hypothetical protein R6Q57_003582 [Mikania cordata]